MCITLKAASGSCISVSDLTLVPSCVSGRQTGFAPLGAWRHFTGDTKYRRVGHSDTSPVSLCHFLDLSVSGPGCGHWGSASRIITLFLENNWCCISIWAHRERRTSLPPPHPPSEGKVFISSQTNTRIRLKAPPLTCGCCRPIRPLIARFTPPGLDAADAHDSINRAIVWTRRFTCRNLETRRDLRTRFTLYLYTRRKKHTHQLPAVAVALTSVSGCRWISRSAPSRTPCNAIIFPFIIISPIDSSHRLIINNSIYKMSKIMKTAHHKSPNVPNECFAYLSEQTVQTPRRDFISDHIMEKKLIAVTT